MNGKVVSIREMRARRDPDYYVRMVSPEAMRDRIEARRKLDRDAETLARQAEERRAEALRRADVDALVAKVAVIAGAIGWMAAVAGMA